MTFSAADLTAMRVAQDGHMFDLCKPQVYSRTYDVLNGPVEVWTEAGTAIACGLDMRPGSERHGTDKTVVQYDATLRLPIGTVLDVKDRINVTHRFGEDTTDLVYEIAGPIQRGPSGIRLLLRKVEV